jgi:hypothetical protein
MLYKWVLNSRVDFIIKVLTYYSTTSLIGCYTLWVLCYSTDTLISCYTLWVLCYSIDTLIGYYTLWVLYAIV